MKKKVLVGMSGGVDSSVAAWLLQRQGDEVIGATMKLWEEETGDSRCCGLDDVNDARMVCHALGIPHYVLNCKAPFRREVVEPFIAEYRPYLLRGVLGVPLIYDISERGKVVTHLIVAVHSVIDGDKADAHLREADFTDMDKTTKIMKRSC